MSELIDNATQRRETLKHVIRQLHAGEAPDQVRAQLIRLLGQVPYGDVVQAEQELIAEGVPTEEILRLCDLHSAVLQGRIDVSQAQQAPPGHPVHTFQQENRALGWEIAELKSALAAVEALPADGDPGDVFAAVRQRFNNLMDVEKHYLRKEHLLFPYLEQHGITGPPKVMWGKHDETRALLQSAMHVLGGSKPGTAGELLGVAALVLVPAAKAIADMIDKEEQILLPMCLDTLSDGEWYEIARQSAEIGFCLYDPPDTWRPETVDEPVEQTLDTGRVRFPSGSLSPTELLAILSTIPFDLTFVDKDDTVRYFTQGRERIFARSRAILGRKVQYCHPPSSVGVVEQILDAFKTGARDHAAFWITMRGRFIHIEYYALRDPAGAYLGCLEVSQDLTEKRALSGEQRLLSWTAEGASHVQ